MSSFEEQFLTTLNDLAADDNDEDECVLFGKEMAAGAKKIPEGYERHCFFQEARQLLFHRRFRHQVSNTAAPDHTY